MLERHYAGAVIKGGANRFLLIHDHRKESRPWRFPGGKIEFNEIALGALVRELWEELGIVVTAAELIAETRTEIDGGVWHGHFFYVKDFDGVPEIQEPDKHDDWQYFTPDEITAMGDSAEGDKLLAIAMGLAARPTSVLEFKK